ncbi:MAG: LysE family transporter [Deltaproteobacteria bacterium]|nr:LysE family transporter [Deltaproteobacteria bacterium]
MQLGLFLKGLLIGFVVAVPIGPMGVLCVSRALSGGPVYGLVSGLGVATGDAIWAGIAALGLTMISGFLLSQQAWLRLIGGIFLCYLGIKTFLTGPRVRTVPAAATGLGRAYASTFFLTFSNPATILSFVAIYAGWGVESLSGHYVSAAVLTAGAFVGSASWWILLSSGLLAFRKSFARSGLEWVERISGAIIAGLGFFIILLSLL